MDRVQLFREQIINQGLEAMIVARPTNCRYLSGFKGTSALLLITPNRQFIITDFRYQEQAMEQAPGFEVVVYDQAPVYALKRLAEEEGLQKLGLDKEYITIAVYEEYKRALKNIRLVPLPDPCHKLRRIKDQAELDLLRKAVEIADMAFGHVLDFLTPGLSEKEVACELEFFMRRLGAEGPAFETIVASGQRSSLPHGVASDKIIHWGETVTLDFGAVYQGYHSDMTRTVFMGKPDSRQTAIYNLVLEAQKQAIAGIQPGQKTREADRFSRSVIIKRGYGDNFGHGLGHGVGLDIHEGPRLSPRDDSVLEPGMVVSVEPGVYIAGWGGVRIEDLVVITPGGCEVITKSPKELQEMIIERK